MLTYIEVLSKKKDEITANKQMHTKRSNVLTSPNWQAWSWVETATVTEKKKSTNTITVKYPESDMAFSSLQETTGSWVQPRDVRNPSFLFY